MDIKDFYVAFTEYHHPNNSAYFRFLKEEIKQRQFVLAPDLNSYQNFVKKANNKAIDFQIIPLVTNEVTLAQLFISNPGVSIIFLSGYTDHPAWDFIKHFIDEKQERVKS